MYVCRRAIVFQMKLYDLSVSVDIKKAKRYFSLVSVRKHRHFFSKNKCLLLLIYLQNRVEHTHTHHTETDNNNNIKKYCYERRKQDNSDVYMYNGSPGAARISEQGNGVAL